MVNSIEPLRHVLSVPPHFLPLHPEVGPYAGAWNSAPFGLFYLNTLFMASAIVLGQLVTSTLAAYALTWLRIPGRQAVFFLILIGLMVPEQLTVVPVFLEMRTLGWINSYQGLIVPFLGSAFGIFLLRQSFLQIPLPLIEAAKVDGASRLQILTRVILPNSKSALITLAILNFIWHYNDFFWPLIITNTNHYRTLAVGLSMFFQSGSGLTPWNQLMAADVFIAVPLFLLFFLGQRYLVQGVMTSGIK